MWKPVLVVAGAGMLLIAGAATTSITGQTSLAPARAYTPPRTRAGQPDLQGIWQVINTAAWDIQDHAGQRFPGLPARFSVPAGQGVVEGNAIPYQTWALARKQETYQNRATADPEAQCYLPGRASDHIHAIPVSDPPVRGSRRDPLRTSTAAGCT